MADATKKLIDSFSDPKNWSKIDDGVPIFTEHTAYALLTADGELMKDSTGRPVLEIVMPGRPAPKNSKVYYTVDAERIKKIAANINAQLKDHRTPIKNFIGHSDPSKKQTDQPPLVGYSVGATVAPWGPEGRATIFSKVYTTKGAPKNTVEYVQRSPEFFPTKDIITGLALLKTDPRLPMGMVPYGEDGPIFYGQSFESYAVQPKAGGMPPEDEEPTVNPGRAAEARPERQRDEMEDGQDEWEKENEPGTEDELTPEEAHQAMRYMSHYERHHPVIKYACDQFRQMNSKGMERMNMSQPATPIVEAADLPVEYQQVPARLTEMEKLLAESQVRYALAESTRIVDGLIMSGYRIKDRAKEIERMKMLDDAGRLDRQAEIRENYQQVDQDPTRGPQIQVYGGQVEGASDEPDYYGRGMTDEQVDAMVQYAEDNNLDLQKQADLDKARKAVLAK